VNIRFRYNTSGGDILIKKPIRLGLLNAKLEPGCQVENIVSDTHILHFKKPIDDINRLEPSTCTEAETFALQVRDSSMEPEFAKDCIIVVDPTGHATDGSYVLAQQQSESVEADPASSVNEPEEILETFLFRQLRRGVDGEWYLFPLNETFQNQPTLQDLSEIVGVIVQRAGTRRRYHKRYD